jgi:hypothetical protein
MRVLITVMQCAFIFSLSLLFRRLVSHELIWITHKCSSINASLHPITHCCHRWWLIFRSGYGNVLSALRAIDSLTHTHTHTHTHTQPGSVDVISFAGWKASLNNIIITILDIIHRPVFYLKHNFRRLASTSVFRWNLLTWVRQTELVSVFEDTETEFSLRNVVLNTNWTMDNVQNCDISSLRTYRSYL